MKLERCSGRYRAHGKRAALQAEWESVDRNHGAAVTGFSLECVASRNGQRSPPALDAGLLRTGAALHGACRGARRGAARQTCGAKGD